MFHEESGILLSRFGRQWGCRAGNETTDLQTPLGLSTDIVPTAAKSSSILLLCRGWERVKGVELQDGPSTLYCVMYVPRKFLARLTKTITWFLLWLYNAIIYVRWGFHMAIKLPFYYRLRDERYLWSVEKVHKTEEEIRWWHTARWSFTIHCGSLNQKEWVVAFFNNMKKFLHPYFLFSGIEVFKNYYTFKITFQKKNYEIPFNKYSFEISRY